MPKRRRLFTPNKYKIKNTAKVEAKIENDVRDREVTSARGRLKGALMEVLEPTAQSDESDHSHDETPLKRERHQSQDNNEYLTDEEVKKVISKSPPRQSYVLKLFDRSVDLSQFRDDSPLYPICRAWMVNQPKVNYNEASSIYNDLEPILLHPHSVELPPPEGPPAPKIPELLPEQKAADKDNIDLNYVRDYNGKRDAAPPTREELLRLHMPRWASVKQAWQDQIVLKEARYEGTQQVLNSINLEYPAR